METAPEVLEQVKRLDLIEQQLSRLQLLWPRILDQYNRAASRDLPPGEGAQAAVLLKEARDIQETLPPLDGLSLDMHLPDMAEIPRAKQDRAEVARINDNARWLNAYADTVKLTRCRVAGSSIQAGVEELQRSAKELLDRLPDQDQLRVWLAEPDAMGQLDALTTELGELLGASIDKPARWRHLTRHISFGMRQDISDIVKHDLPAIEAGLRGLVGPQYFQPPTAGQPPMVPAVKGDVPNIVHAKIDWRRINADQFEELCQKVLEGLPNWVEVRRPTETNAPDKGKDLCARIVMAEHLSGTQDERNVLVQCRHTNVGQGDLYDPVTLQTWHNKLHYILLITSGKLSEGVEGLIRTWNEALGLPQVRYVTGDELAKFLKQKRPDLVEEYDLAADGDDGDGSGSDG